ncbi:hypothetical protein [Natronorubrum texcoconense]|uniref:Uncharacterized protein n=1 Tax=Natronorubrum texcoconense TaxID=1095776 RepID=A0A1G9E1S6_9EURY|nr:hypothetical protein [Natronorubrum texcoconense]SDK70069.1 hypothetical protein SAMN04515672_3722 [Natronorubrum texcoconense]
MMTSTEEPITRLTRWLRQRPNSIEFWELVLTNERLVWCYVGQSYRSMLLRADMGERDRAVVEDSHLEELVNLAEENFAIPLEALESIRHVEGTRFRRARLELEWSEAELEETRYGGQMTLVSTSEADPQEDVVAGLAEDSRLEHVDIELDTPRWSLL